MPMSSPQMTRMFGWLAIVASLLGLILPPQAQSRRSEPSFAVAPAGRQELHVPHGAAGAPLPTGTRLPAGPVPLASASPRIHCPGRIPHAPACGLDVVGASDRDHAARPLAALRSGPHGKAGAVW